MDTTGKQIEDTPAPVALAPLLVGRREAARLLGVSAPTLDRLAASGELGPLPVKLGGRVLYRVAELAAWTDHGCPSRKDWLCLWAALREDSAERTGAGSLRHNGRCVGAR